MIEDNLKDELNKVAESAKDIENAPVTISLTERNKLVIFGEKNYKELEGNYVRIINSRGWKLLEKIRNLKRKFKK